jgi:L-erythro-3,5-diaminohexanoate dehydrogenase
MSRDHLDGDIIAIDRDTSVAEHLQTTGLIDAVGRADATSPVEVIDTAERLLREQNNPDQRVDLALNTCNVADTEMATILTVKHRGTAFFFNMATDFTAATLGAEGVGRDIDLMMGNGYVRGHAELTTEILRDTPIIRRKLEELVN